MWLVLGEAQCRTLELVQTARLELEKEQKGVWASLGRPYVCHGQPAEVSDCPGKVLSGCHPLDQGRLLPETLKAMQTKVNKSYSVPFILIRMKQEE